MSVKRKAGGNGNSSNKRRPKKMESDYEDDVSDDSTDDIRSSSNQVEVSIPHYNLDPPTQLPSDLLAEMEKTSIILLISGMVTWDLTFKCDRKNVVKIRPNLYSFRFPDETYRYVARGCTSAHILINMDRKALSFGRNPNGQLRLPDSKLCEKPTIIHDLEYTNIIQAACGRHYSFFLTDTKSVYACGENKSGQCGIGTTSPVEASATLARYRGPPIIRVGCGAEFSVIENRARSQTCSHLLAVLLPERNFAIYPPIQDKDLICILFCMQTHLNSPRTSKINEAAGKPIHFFGLICVKF